MTLWKMSDRESLETSYTGFLNDLETILLRNLNVHGCSHDNQGALKFMYSEF